MFLKKRWSLLLLKHRRQTAKFQFVGRLYTLLGLHFNATLQPDATRTKICVIIQAGTEVCIPLVFKLPCFFFV